MKKSSVDLTTGNITKQILVFAFPLLVGQIFQNLYNSVDAIVVGNHIGTTALAAVSASADIAQILVGFFLGLSTGASVLFARSFGAQNQKALHDAIHTAITFAILVGLSMALIGIIFAPFLLRISDCPDDVTEEALIYLRIYLVGVLFTAIYNVGSSVLRACGDSRSPFYYLIISSMMNILLDVLLVVILKIGVAGAALATVFSQLVSVLLVFRRMILTEDVYRFSFRDLGLKKELLKEVVILGLPAAAQQCLISVSNMFLLRYINSFGSASMAGIGVAKKIDKFVGMVTQSLGLAVATFVGQNVGAKKYARAYRGVRHCILMALSYVAIAGGLLYTFAYGIVSLFTKDPEAGSVAAAMVRIMMPFYLAQGIYQILSNTVRGFGKSLVIMVLSIVGMIGVRQLFLAVAFSFAHDIRFLFYAYPVGWFGAISMVLVYYFFWIKRKYPSTDLERSEAV